MWKLCHFERGINLVVSRNSRCFFYAKTRDVLRLNPYMVAPFFVFFVFFNKKSRAFQTKNAACFVFF